MQRTASPKGSATGSKTLPYKATALAGLSDIDTVSKINFINVINDFEPLKLLMRHDVI